MVLHWPCRGPSAGLHRMPHLCKLTSKVLAILAIPIVQLSCDLQHAFLLHASTSSWMPTWCNDAVHCNNQADTLIHRHSFLSSRKPWRGRRRLQVAVKGGSEAVIPTRAATPCWAVVLRWGCPAGLCKTHRLTCDMGEQRAVRVHEYVPQFSNVRDPKWW